MNLHHLKVFLAVAQTGSISGGAARLFISQPAVTREIRELEGRLQLPLFDRQTRGVSLTEAGQRLLPYAERIFALEQAAERDLAEFASLGAGELRLCASATLGSYLLPGLIAEFRQQHPGLSISLQIGNTASSLRALESAAQSGELKAGAAETDIFITPGYRFRVVDRLITNFHLPKSTLLMLVSAFAGTEAIRAAYAHAVTERYRFFSYGDAMLLEKSE